MVTCCHPTKTSSQKIHLTIANLFHPFLLSMLERKSNKDQENKVKTFSFECVWFVLYFIFTYCLSANRIFVHQFRVTKSECLVRKHWLKWKFQLTVFMMARRSELKRRQRCVKKYYDIWKLVTKKCKLARKLEESSPYFCILLKKRNVNVKTICKKTRVFF